MRPLLLISIFALPGALLLAGQNDAPPVRDHGYWVRTIQGTIAASGMDRLRIQTTGSVHLHGVSDANVNYSLKVRVKASDAREAEVLLRQISVKTGTEGGWTYIRVTPPRQVSTGSELTVTGPRGLRDVRVDTLGGDLEVTGFDGSLEARSAGGRIAIDQIGGASDVMTAGGDIQVGTVGGPLRCSSGGGGIKVGRAAGPVRIQTNGGEVAVHEAGGAVDASTGGGNIRVDRAGGAVVARTAGGLIQVQQAAGPVVAETSGGAILVNSAQGVRCESAGGSIRLRNVAGALHASANSGSIMAQLASRAMENSLLSTNAGDITVLSPSNLALTIQAMNESGGTGRIISDFPEVRPQNGGQPAVGPVIARGALNGGGPLLRLNAMGGTIYLRREK